MPDAKAETDVEGFLRKINATEYADGFIQAGYRDVADLNDEVVKDVMKGKPAGAIARIQRLVKAKNAPQTPAELAQLPEGTKIDLSWSAGKAPDGKEFALPSQLSVQPTGKEVFSATSLMPQDWVFLASNSKLLHAYTMGDIDPGALTPPQGRRPVLHWVVPQNTFFFTPEETCAGVTTTVTYSDEVASLVHMGFDQESAKASFVFASASFERNHTDKEATSSDERRMRMVGRWYFPRVTLYIPDCTVVSREFVQDVIEALHARSRAEQFKRLSSVFEIYGTAYAREVTLGGALSFIHTQDANDKKTEHQVQTTYKAALNLKLGNVSGGGAGAGGKGESESRDTQDLADEISFTAIGGDTTLVTSPAAWTDTVKPPHHWAVIARRKLTSVVSLLPEDLQRSVLDLWANPENLLPQVHSGLRLGPVDDDLTRRMAGFLVVKSVAARDRAATVSVSCGPTEESTRLAPSLAGSTTTNMKDNGADAYQSSLCLPVPTGWHCASSVVDNDTPPGKDPHLNTGADVGLVTTTLSFRIGDRLSWDLQSKGATPPSLPIPSANSDRLLFVSLKAEPTNARGSVHCIGPDHTTYAGACVQHRPGMALAAASFCIPLSADREYQLEALDLVDSPKIGVSYWLIEVTSTDYRFGAVREIQPDVAVLAEADGFLWGGLFLSEDSRMVVMDLKVLAADAAPTPWSAGVAVKHAGGQANLWNKCATAMLPVLKGATYQVTANPRVVAPTLRAYWMPIIPR